MKATNKMIRVTNTQILAELGTAVAALRDCDALVIGAGAGCSISSGVDYYDREWFCGTYPGMVKEGYSYPYELVGNSEFMAKGPLLFWGYLAAHCMRIRFDIQADDTYSSLLSLVSSKPYFVRTSNVDGLFERAGFDTNRLYTVQGDMAYLQCQNKCREDAIWSSREVLGKLVANTDKNTQRLNDPELIPTCPFCNSHAVMNLRAGDYFSDFQYMPQFQRYNEFIADICKASKQIVLLEIGAGFNTPGVIRAPFERLAMENANVTLIRVNLEHPETPGDLSSRGISIPLAAEVAIPMLSRLVGSQAADIIMDYEIPRCWTQTRILQTILPMVVQECDHGHRTFNALRNGYITPREYLRHVMTINTKRTLSNQLLNAMDALLLLERNDRPTIQLEEVMRTSIVATTFEGHDILVWKGDITLLHADCIVNAANSGMLGCFTPGHTCIDNVIHDRAGPRLRLECREVSKAFSSHIGLPTGEARLTMAYNLPSTYVIHTVGPIIQRGKKPSEEDAANLRKCYRSVLKLCEEHSINSVAFCSISTGVFGYAVEAASGTVLPEVREYCLEGHRYPKTIIIDVFSDRDADAFSSALRHLH